MDTVVPPLRDLAALADAVYEADCEAAVVPPGWTSVKVNINDACYSLSSQGLC